MGDPAKVTLGFTLPLPLFSSDITHPEHILLHEIRLQPRRMLRQHICTANAVRPQFNLILKLTSPGDLSTGQGILHHRFVFLRHFLQCQI
jgi:hypothetical protein